MIYENGILKRILVDGGYIEGGVYYFYLADHEGNNRVVANAGGTVVQTNHYYPFGMPFAEGNATSSQPYKYNGKELDTERGLNLYDYGARLYDPALARFTSVDPMAEKKPWMSSYFYCSGNPLNRIDPDGRDDYKMDRDGNMTLVKQTDAKNHTIYATNSNGGIDNKNSVQVSKDVLDFSMKQTISINGEKFDTNTYSVLDDKQAKDFFEFAANNSNVEWANTSITYNDEEGSSNYNLVSTAHQYGSNASVGIITKDIGYAIKDNYLTGNNVKYQINKLDHNHTNSSTTPSGQPLNNNRISGDIGVAKKINALNDNNNAVFRIYSSETGQYYPFSANDTPWILPEIIIPYTPQK
jgi:RHS repeat-associated protein